VGAAERGSYLKYSAVMRYFLKKTTLPALLQHAGDPSFGNWLKALR
jgi:hypothetical protein